MNETWESIRYGVIFATYVTTGLVPIVCPVIYSDVLLLSSIIMIDDETGDDSVKKRSVEKSGLVKRRYDGKIK